MLPFLAPLISGLLPILAETAADKLLGDDHPMSDTVKRSVLAAAEQVIGGPIMDKMTAEEAAIEISGDPAMKLEFQRLMNARAADILTAETERLRAVLADVQNARAREIATGDRTVAYLAYLVFGVWAAQTALVLTMGLPQQVPDAVLGRLLGGVENLVMLVAGYYWGSSHLPRK